MKQESRIMERVIIERDHTYITFPQAITIDRLCMEHRQTLPFDYHIDLSHDVRGWINVTVNETTYSIATNGGVH